MIAARLFFCLSLACAAPAAAAEDALRAPTGSVAIYRDSMGVPHLYAEREEDAWFGLGYAMAQDRLPQILLFYRYLKGETAEAFGPGPLGENTGVPGFRAGVVPDAVASDLSMRRAGFVEGARSNFGRLSPQLQADMAAFTAGLQSWMNEHPERVPAWAPTLEPALPLAGGAFLMRGSTGAPGPCAEDAGQVRPEGSNVWALAASRTTDGAAIFSSDSHGAIALFGTFFYAARLNTPSLDAWMLDVVGMPMGLKGHSRAYAWGWAEGPRFPADCLAVKTGTDPQTYLHDGVQRRFTLEPYEIRVRGGETVRGTFEITDHNGVRSPVVRRDGETAYVVSDAYAGRDGFAHDQFLAMMRAGDRAVFLSAMERIDIYPANLIVAGADGSILYVRPGRIPHRPAGTDPRLALDGNTSTSAWLAPVRPLSALVQLENPPQGYLTNENVSPDAMFAEPVIPAEAYPSDFAFEPGQTGSRQRRAIELFEGTGPFSWTRALAAVADVKVHGSEAWGAAARLLAEAEPDVALRGFLNELAMFDGRFEPSSRSALGHALWREALRADVSAALPIEQAVASGQPLTAAHRATLTAAAVAALTQRNALGGPHLTFGDVYRVGRGSVSEPGRGYTLLALPGDTTGASDASSLWAAIYEAQPDASTRRLVSDTRWPFLVQFTDPIRSYSLPVEGVSDDPASPRYSDQSHHVGDGRLQSNAFEPAELGRVAGPPTILRTGLP